jgi:hypothetical protein
VEHEKQKQFRLKKILVLFLVTLKNLIIDITAVFGTGLSYSGVIHKVDVSKMSPKQSLVKEERCIQIITTALKK